MALTTTPGAYNSDSYVLLEDVPTILGDLGLDATNWNTLTGQIQEQMLRLAADSLGYFFTFRGWKAYRNQRLAFPRAQCQELLGLTLTEIPKEIQQAQVYVASEIVAANYLTRSSVDEQAQQVSGSADDIAGFTVKGLSVTFMKTSIGSTVSSIFADFIADKHAMLHWMLNSYTTQLKIMRGRPDLLDPVTTTTSTSTTTTTV